MAPVGERHIAHQHLEALWSVVHVYKRETEGPGYFQKITKGSLAAEQQFATLSVRQPSDRNGLNRAMKAPRQGQASPQALPQRAVASPRITITATKELGSIGKQQVFENLSKAALGHVGPLARMA